MRNLIESLHYYFFLFGCRLPSAGCTFIKDECETFCQPHSRTDCRRLASTFAASRCRASALRASGRLFGRGSTCWQVEGGGGGVVSESFSRSAIVLHHDWGLAVLSPPPGIRFSASERASASSARQTRRICCTMRPRTAREQRAPNDWLTERREGAERTQK